MKVSSLAALGILTVSAGDIASNPGLQLVCKLASQRKKTIKIQKKK
jgi:hypothetical protein